MSVSRPNAWSKLSSGSNSSGVTMVSPIGGMWGCHEHMPAPRRYEARRHEEGPAARGLPARTASPVTPDESVAQRLGDQAVGQIDQQVAVVHRAYPAVAGRRRLQAVDAIVVD